VKAGAYDTNAGWTYKGLIGLAGAYGLGGNSYDLSGASKDAALAKFKAALADGPVIASVHYTFDPKNPIPHLVVITAIDGDTVYYNDPAATAGGKSITLSKFVASWKQRFIVIRPLRLT
jgi:hypothetical protein